jgi:type I restriction enzyme S subunit
VNNWKETTLGEVAVFNYGKGLPTESRKAGDVPVYGSSGITGFHNEALITEAGYIIGRKGTVGSIHYSDKPFYPIDTVYYLTKQDIKCDFRFFYYLLQTLGLDKLNFDSAVPGLNRETAYSLRITIPATEAEQKAIAAILSSFDDKIELLRRQNKTLEQIAQTIFKEWFVNFTVNGEKLKVNSKTGLPEGWRMGKLGEIIEIYGGGTPKTNIAEYWNGNIPWFSAGDSPSENNVFVLGCEKHISKEGLENSSTKILPVNTTIITARGTVGKLALTGVPMAMNQSCYGITPKDNNSFFYLYLLMKESLAALKSQVHGAIFDTITRDTLNNIELVIASDKIINLFETATKPVFHKILQNNTQIQTLSKLRDSLLPKLMKGEIRVKG